MAMGGIAAHSHGGGTGHGSTHPSGHALPVRGGRSAMRTGHHSTGNPASRAIWALMSPRVLFSILLGVGTSGVLLRPVLGGTPLLLLAGTGGILFERIIVAPIWNFALRFASEPAHTLESAIADEARAVTTFDANGLGMIEVDLDGQVVRVLGTLVPADRSAGVRIHSGDRVRIEAVDAERNRCTVSAL